MNFRAYRNMIYCFILGLKNNLLGTKPISWCINVTETLKTLACSTGFCNPTLDLATKYPSHASLNFSVIPNKQNLFPSI